MPNEVYSPMGDATPSMPGTDNLKKIDIDSPIAADPVSIPTGDMIDIDYSIEKNDPGLSNG